MRGKATMRRSEVSERLDKHQAEAREKGDTVEENVEDVEIESQVLDELEGGTEDAAEQVEECIERAQDASCGEFDKETSELEEIHDQIHEYEEQMHEQSDIAANNAEKVGDASGQLHRDAPRSALEQAQEALRQDMEFLSDHEQHAREAREESKQRNDDQSKRIAAARKK